MGLVFKPGEKQTEFVGRLKAALRSGSGAVQVHVIGPAGVGKTRLVFEAVKDSDIQPLVLYTSRANELLDSEFFANLTSSDNVYSVVLVVDECGSSSRTQIWNRLKNRGARIKLVTINNEYEDFNGASILDVPLLGREEIVQIIESYNVAVDQAERFAGFCSGSPRVAHVLGQNLKLNPEDLTKTPGTIDVWGRYVAGDEGLKSESVRNRFTVLKYLALFKRFGYGDPVVAEAKAISALIEKDHRDISWGRFRDILSDLRKRKILQGETTLYITPELFHIWLWGQWWDNYGDGFDLEKFAKEFGDGLLPWFLEMFKYAEQSQVSQKIVSKILGPTGPFKNRDFLNSELGGDFFLALTDVDPKQALRCLERTIGQWDREDLLRFTDGRRGVIWALERIAIWKDTFHGAAKLLLKLAEAENESWSNNATGMFAELFSPGYGEVAPTEASPQERLPVLKEALLSESETTRGIALKAFDEALEAQHFTRTVGPEHQGFKPKPKLWTPKTYGEIFDAYRQVWLLLKGQLLVLQDKQRAEAVQILLNNGAAIILATNLYSLVLDTWREILALGWKTKAEILERLIFLLKYRREELTPEVVGAVEVFRDELVGKDFPSLLKRYVAMDLLDDRFDEKDRVADTRDQKIRELAEECIANPELLRAELAWLVTDEAKNGYRFGYELAKLDVAWSLLENILEEQRKKGMTNGAFCLSGYLRAIFEKETGTWESLLDRLVADDQLRIHVPELTWRSGMTDQAAFRILELAKSGRMEINRFGMFGMGSVIKNLGEGSFRQWADFLVSLDGDIGVRILMDLFHFYYLSVEPKKEFSKDLAFQMLAHPVFFRGGGAFHTMDKHHWSTVGVAFVAKFPEESLKLAEMIIDHFGEKGTVVSGHSSEAHKVLSAITDRKPVEVWHLISLRLGPPIDSRAYRLKSWLRGDKYSTGGEGGVLPRIPLEEVWKWVDADREQRSWYLATFVPKELFRSVERPCLAREVLIRYGHSEVVRRNLAANFSTEGWSGRASIHYRQKKDWLLDFKKDESNANVRFWIDEYVENLQRRIDDSKVQEEREDF